MCVHVYVCIIYPGRRHPNIIIKNSNPSNLAFVFHFLCHFIFLVINHEPLFVNLLDLLVQHGVPDAQLYFHLSSHHLSAVHNLERKGIWVLQGDYE